MKSESRFLKAAVACGAVVVAVLAIGAQESSKTQGVDRADMDTSVKPGNDFYGYANGTWLKRTEIPPDRASYGVFGQLFDVASKRTAGLIEEAAKSSAPERSGKRKIADLYNSYMDEAGIESRGIAPLKPRLDTIAAVSDKKQLARALGESIRADVDPLNNTNFHTANIFGLWVAPNFNNPSHYTAYLMQGGVELPDREYYLSDNEHMNEIRAEYQAHVSRMLKLAGFSDTDARAKRIFDLEHAIAEKHWTLAEDQDIHKANNPWKRAEFATKAPGLDWDEFFQGAGLDEQQAFIVWQPSAFAGESSLVASESLGAWKDLLAYHVIEEYGSALPKAIVDERFAFFGKTLSGTPQMLPRWRRGVNVVNGVLGDEVGRLYAQRYFPPEAKKRVQAMVENIKAAFRKRVDALSWMDPATKAEAKTKLDSLYVGIGYPETWHDYDALDIKHDDIFGNLWRSDLFEYRRQVSRLGKAVDRHEWSMTPQTVNAVNLPLQNALNFPAAILEPPFFDSKAPDAANYGSIGSIIGHEVSHTFDTEGSTFDANGALRNWWKPADLEHFNAATKKLAQQYDTYRPFPDLSLNGQQTLAENIADLGGLAASYEAYRASLNGRTAPVEAGLSGDQQFFLAFAQGEKNKERDAALRRQVMTDEHSPSRYRVATVRNLDPWYSAFDVKTGEKLYLPPDERVRIW
jgi:endothelin-converting enzyme/putative endopeptidase